jgi:hypothetical protein
MGRPDDDAGPLPLTDRLPAMAVGLAETAALLPTVPTLHCTLST